MSWMFRSSISFNQNLSLWNVSNVTSCEYFNLSTPSWTLPKPNFSLCTP